MKASDIQIGMKVWIKNSWASSTVKHRQNGMVGTICSLPYSKDPDRLRTTWYADVDVDGVTEKVLLCKIKAMPD